MADNNWVRIVNTTMQKFFRTVEEAVLRRRVVPAMLNQRGGNFMNASGKFMDWKIRFKRAPLQGLLGGDTLTFTQRDQHRTAQLEYRGFGVTNSITDFELQQNKGNEAIVKVWDEAAKLLASDLQDGFADMTYIDGNATGNESFVHGLNSFFSVSGASTKMPIGINNDTYAGRSTALAADGGSWSTTGTNTTYTDWPQGTGDYNYDYFTPLVVDYTSAVATSLAAGNYGWSAATKTWANTCMEALRFALMGVQKNDGSETKTDLVILEQQMMRDLKNKLQAEEQLNVTRNEGAGSAYAVGFQDVINFDGVDCLWEYGVPTGEGFGIPLGLIELHSLQDQLFKAGGPVMREEDQSYRIWAKFMGNYKCGNEKGGIRNFFKVDNVS